MDAKDNGVRGHRDRVGEKVMEQKTDGNESSDQGSSNHRPTDLYRREKRHP
jgi:hypothetical protein